MSSIHTRAVLGIDDIDLASSRKGLRVTLVLPHLTQPLTPAELPYWQEQVRLFDDSRIMFDDIKALVRVLRALPESAQTDESRALLERMKGLDVTEVQS